MSDPSDASGQTSAYGQLLGMLVEAPDLDAFLGQVAVLAAAVVTSASACGITVARDGQPFTVACSADLAAQVDEIQYGADQGPCLDAMRTGRVVYVADLAQERRWDRYRPHAIAHGVISSLSLPLAMEGQTIAAMNLYANQANAFDGSPRHRAEAFAAQCAAALTLTLRQAEQAQLHRQLSEAITSRSVIDQAVGVLMGQQRCTAPIAFSLLRQASQHRNRKLRDIAVDIITSITGRPPQPTQGFHTGP